MKRVNIRDKEFKVIPENGVVKGEMMTKGVAHDLSMGIKNKYKMLVRYALNSAAFFKTNDSIIKAKAYCDSNDKFDERRGIEVCSAKLELKNHRRLAKWYDRAARDLQEASLVAQSFCIRHEEKAQAIEDDLCRTFGRLPM